MTAAPTTVAAPVRRTLPLMRALLMVFCALTALAVGALFVLSDNTAETFAWTIKPSITAAFLGAGYAAGFVLVALLKFPLAYVLLVLGSLGCVLAYRGLR